MKKNMVFLVVYLVIATASKVESADTFGRVDSYIDGSAWHMMDKVDKAAYISGYQGGVSYILTKMYKFDYDVKISSDFHADAMFFFDFYTVGFDFESWITAIDNLYRRDERYVKITVGQMIMLISEIAESAATDTAVTDMLEEILASDMSSHSDVAVPFYAADLIDTRALGIKNISKSVYFLAKGDSWGRAPVRHKRAYMVGYLNGFNDIALRVLAGRGSQTTIDQKFADEIECYINACADQPNVEWWLTAVESLYKKDGKNIQIPADFMIKLAARICCNAITDEAVDKQIESYFKQQIDNSYGEPDYLETGKNDILFFLVDVFLWYGIPIILIFRTFRKKKKRVAESGENGYNKKEGCMIILCILWLGCLFLADVAPVGERIQVYIEKMSN